MADPHLHSSQTDFEIGGRPHPGRVTRTTAALIRLKYKIQHLNTSLKYHYKALMRNVKAQKHDNDCLSTSLVNTHAILAHPLLSLVGQHALKN